MKKPVGKSLVLLALGVGAVFLLGGRSVFSKVLSNLKSTPTPKKEEKPLEEKEATTKDLKQEEKDLVGPEIALDEATKAEEPIAEELVKKEEEREEVKPQPQSLRQEPKAELAKPKPAEETPERIIPKPSPRIQATKPIKWREIPSIFWSPRRGRLYDTKEEIAWKQNYVSPFADNGSGKRGTGIWCLTPNEDPYEVDNPTNCPNKNR